MDPEPGRQSRGASGQNGQFLTPTLATFLQLNHLYDKTGRRVCLRAWSHPTVPLEQDSVKDTGGPELYQSTGRSGHMSATTRAWVQSPGGRHYSVNHLIRKAWLRQLAATGDETGCVGPPDSDQNRPWHSQQD